MSPDTSPVASPHSRISFRDLRWTLRTGDELSIGRSLSNDIRLPDDPLISRIAGVVVAHDDHLFIQNRSATRPMLLRPPAGADRVIEERSARSSQPFSRFQIVLEGRDGEVSLGVRILVPTGEAAGRARKDEPPTVTAPFHLTGAQRAVVEALCAPMLTRNGPLAVPATYKAVGIALDRSPQYVRNVVSAIRVELAGHGFPGFVSDDGDAGAADFRLPLALHAIRVGWVAPLARPTRDVDE